MSGLQNVQLFENIKESELALLFPCLNAKSKSYRAGQTICDYGEKRERIGILESGAATLERLDLAGNRTILELLTENSMFGEVLVLAGENQNNLSVVCSENCRVLFIDYDHLTKRCEKACTFHSTLVQNLLRLVARRALDLTERLQILSCRSIREKLYHYFLLTSSKQAYTSFTLPFNLTELADYICADRSAMMRELKKMKEDGLITISGRTVSLINPTF